MKAGFNPSGSSDLSAENDNGPNTRAAKEKGYAKETRILALRMYVESNSQRAIAHILKVSPQSVSNWINAYEAKLPSVQKP